MWNLTLLSFYALENQHTEGYIIIMQGHKASNCRIEALNIENLNTAPSYNTQDTLLGSNYLVWGKISNLSSETKIENMVSP